MTPQQLGLYLLLRNQLGTHECFTPPRLPDESPHISSMLDGIRARHGGGRLPARRHLIDEQQPSALGGSTMTLTQETPTATLTPDWRRWVAENLMLRVPPDDLVAILASHGIEPVMARRGVDAVSSDPCFQAGEWMAQRLHKLESVLDIHQDLQRLGGDWRSIDRRRDLTR